MLRLCHRVKSHHLVPDGPFRWVAWLHPLPCTRSQHGNHPSPRPVPDCFMEITLMYASSQIVPYPSFCRQLDRVVDSRGITFRLLLDRLIVKCYFPSVSGALTGWSPIHVPKFDQWLCHRGKVRNEWIWPYKCSPCRWCPTGGYQVSIFTV